MTYDEAARWASQVSGQPLSRDALKLPTLDAQRVIAKILEIECAVVDACKQTRKKRLVRKAKA